MRTVARTMSSAGRALTAGFLFLSLAVHGQTEDLPELDLSVLEPGVQEALAAARSRFEESAAAAEDEAAEKAAAAAERTKACERARARLETYLQSRRLYRTDENGERVYLDDTERQEARQKAEEQITEFCS